MKLADVTSTSPLQVRRKKERLAVPAVATDVTVAVSDVVITEIIENQVYILAKVV